MTCEHPDVAVLCDFNRLTHTEDGPVVGFNLDINVQCQKCGMPFCFRGLPLGVSQMNPTMSLNALTARMPIHPEDDPTFGIGLPGVSIRVIHGEEDGGPAEPDTDTSNPDDHGVLG